MIGRLAGRLDYKASDHVLIDVRGVGYIVYVSDRTLRALPPAGQACALYTELVVREDLLQLFGFTSLVEKEWHKLLTSVQGVGAKVAMAILGTLGPDGVARAITLGDAGAVRRAPGVGPKLAQRLVLELKDKAPTIMAMGSAAPDLDTDLQDDTVIEEVTPAPAPKPAKAAKPDSAARQSAQNQADALSALTNLGYSPSDAAQAVALAAETETETPALIRAALKKLAPQ